MSFPKHVFIEKYPEKIEILHSFYDYAISSYSGINSSMFLFVAWNTIYIVVLTFSDHLFTTSQS